MSFSIFNQTEITNFNYNGEHEEYHGGPLVHWYSVAIKYKGGSPVLFRHSLDYYEEDQWEVLKSAILKDLMSQLAAEGRYEDFCRYYGYDPDDHWTQGLFETMKLNGDSTIRNIYGEDFAMLRFELLGS